MIRPTFPAVLTAALPLLFTAAASAQLGGVGGEFPADRLVFRSALPDTGETWVSSAGIGVLISPDGSKVWGYSEIIGGLAPLPVDVPEAERGKIAPVVSPNIAALIVDGTAYFYGGASGEWGAQTIGDREDARPIVSPSVGVIRVADGVYAYSGITGTGGLHPLAEGEKTGGPAVGLGYARVASDRGFGIFSARAGKWGSVTYPKPAPAAENAEQSGAANAGGQPGDGAGDSLPEQSPPEAQSADTTVRPGDAPAPDADADEPERAEAAPAPPTGDGN